MRISACLFITCLGLAQDNMTDIDNLMNRIEAKNAKVVNWTALGADTEVPTGLKQAVESYWQAFHDRNFFHCYESHFSVFKNHMTSQAYVSRKRINVNGIDVLKGSIMPGSCAVFEIKMNAKAEMFNLSNMKVKQKWVFENGTWKVFQMPKNEQMGFQFSKKKLPDYPFPCEENLSPQTGTKQTKQDVKSVSK